MLLNRDKMIKELIREGFKTETLSLFNDQQVKTLYRKIVSEIRQSAIMSAQADLQRKMENAKEAYDKTVAEIQKAQKKLQSQQKAAKSTTNETEDVEAYSKENDGTKTIDTDNVGNPDVDIKKDDEDLKLITDKKNTESVTNEMVEDWMLGVVNKKQNHLTKSKLIEMVKNYQEEDDYDVRTYSGYDPSKKRTKLFSSVEQEYAFEQLNKYVLELEGYQIMVDELERGEDPEEDILYLILASDAGFTWDIMIYTDGNIYMDGAPIQDSQDLEEEIREKESGGENFFDVEEELSETERDTEGAYMGAPVGTEMPVKTPVRTPTTTPTTPKRRKGPFTRPSVKPKPKAGKEDMPNWMGFKDITSQVENS